MKKVTAFRTEAGVLYENKFEALTDEARIEARVKLSKMMATVDYDISPDDGWYIGDIVAHAAMLHDILGPVVKAERAEAEQAINVYAPTRPKKKKSK